MTGSDNNCHQLFYTLAIAVVNSIDKRRGGCYSTLVSTFNIFIDSNTFVSLSSVRQLVMIQSAEPTPVTT